MLASFPPRRRPRAAAALLILVSPLLFVATCSAFQVSQQQQQQQQQQKAPSSSHASNRKFFNSYARSYSQYPQQHAASRYLPASASRLAAAKEDDGDDPDAWDSPEDYADFGKDSSTSGDGKKRTGLGGQPSLGIDIGGQLNPLSDEEAAELRAEGAKVIEDAFSSRLDEIEDLKATVRKDFERSREALSAASDLRAREETEKLMGKIDKLSNDFLASNEELRMGTKAAADADARMGRKGEGLEVGSWGVDSFGRVVVTSSSSAAGGSGLIGGFAAGLEKAARDLAKSSEDGTSIPPAAAAENKVLILSDDGQDKDAKKILDRFVQLLSEAFDDSIAVERISTSKPAPLGGLDAQTAIIVASCINGKSGADTLLDRILRRTSGAGGKIGTPPTHLVCLSSLGTERTDKFPYSMANMMGGKLTKRREVEEAIINTVKRRLPGTQVPLDYTIAKYGDVVDDAKAKGALEIMPGDSLDDAVGIEAAARTLVQAVAFQPSARNATMSLAGGLTPGEEPSDRAWDDSFLRLNGPELFRIDGLAGSAALSKAKLDKRHDRLVEYIREWSEMFEGGAKGTGLTTPVMLRQSHRDASEAEGTIRRSGIRILFKQTNTGAAYKSKDEERALERQGSPATTAKPAGSATAVQTKRKASKEGGVEVLVEETLDNDLRVRARRCNMDDRTVVKELSEQVIVKQLEKAVGVWQKDHA